MSEPGIAWLGVALLLAIGALLVWLAGRSRIARSGLPAGELVYQDMERQFSGHDAIFSSALGLAGRPDYVVQDEDGSMVPVEIKSGNAPPEPYDGHILQLAAYCLLVEEAFGVRPSHGILQYRDRSFAVDFTYELEADLLDLLEAMRHERTGAEVFRNHDSSARCAHCAFISYCDQSLV